MKNMWNRIVAWVVAPSPSFDLSVLDILDRQAVHPAPGAQEQGQHRLTEQERDQLALARAAGVLRSRQ